MDVRWLFNDGGQDRFTVRRLFLFYDRREGCLFVVVRAVARVLISELVRPVLNLFVSTVFGVAVHFRGDRMFVSRVPSFFGSGAVGTKVHRCFEAPTQVEDEGRVWDVTRVANDRFYFLGVTTIDFVSGSSVHRFRSASLGPLRFVADANRLSRRGRVRREVRYHFTLPCSGHFGGGLVGTHHLAGCSHFADLADCPSRQAYQQAEPCGELQVSK